MGKRFIVTGFKTDMTRMAELASVFSIVLVAAVAGPTGIDSGIFAFKTALAANNGTAKGGHKADAPGQMKKSDGLDTGPADPAEAIGAEGGGDPLPDDLLPIDAEAAPANIEVIKEIAGLPDESSLSEQEELEAIQSGWDTWRTADGPNTSTIQ